MCERVSGDRSLVTAAATLVTRRGREKTQLQTPAGVLVLLSNSYNNTSLQDTHTVALFLSLQSIFIACVTGAVLPSYPIMCSVIGQLA